MGNSQMKQHYEISKKTGTLNISYSKLHEFPPQLNELVEFIRNLDLSNNKFLKLPNEIGKFTLLKQLNVSGNKLTDLPDVMGLLVKLETLNASINQIVALPTSLSNLKHLKQVNLSDNKLVQFPLMFGGLKHLDVLDLSRNTIAIVPDGVCELHVVELILNQNQISSLSEKVAECPRLKTLRIEENLLQIQALSRHILEDSKISLLAIEGNLFQMKQFPNIDGYDKYMERYTAVKKKMF